MELLIKQRVFSWTDSYDVFDEAGRAKYFVKAQLLSLGHQIRVYDKDSGRELGSIHQKLFTLLPTFEIRRDGRTLGTVRKKFTLFAQNYLVDYRGWDVEGDFLGWDYRVYRGNEQVMAITKQWLSWGDTYRIQFDDPADELAGLLLVIAIDAANCTHNE